MRAPPADTATYARREDAATIEHRAFMKAAWRLVPFVTIGSVATLGGFVGPYAMGWLRDATGSFSAGLLAMAGLLVLATVMSWSLKLSVTQE